MATTINTVLRKYNPGICQSDDELIKQFVVRREQLNLVLEVLGENIDSNSNQHLLVVAPRGRGKTMLLAGAAAEIRRSGPLRNHLLPVRFMEESHEVHGIADFWLECLLHLSNALHGLDPDRSKSLRQTHAELALIMVDKSLEQRARASVLDTADSLNRKLVLMIENLQGLAHDADDDFGWQLRKTLQTEPRIMFVATATSHFAALDDVKEPYYETFREIGLPSLDSEQCAKLWQAITGEAVSSREITPLKILTGGSPRLLVIVAGFARHRSMRQLMEQLVTLVDENTEYFKSHLESLAPKERKVYLAVVDLWQESTSKEIAQRARMEIRVTSSLLGRLVNRGAVLVNNENKKKFYAVSERLYSIYYKLRRERGDAAIVKSLIRFMSAFYTGPDLRTIVKQLLSESKADSVIGQGLQLALREDAHMLDLFLGCISDEDFHNLPVAAIDAGEWIAAKWQTIRQDIENGEFDQALSKIQNLIEVFKATKNVEWQWVLGRAYCARGLIQKLQDQPDEAVASFQEAIEHLGDTDHPERQVVLALALLNRGILLGGRDQSEEALVNYQTLIERFGDTDHPELRVLVARALNYRGAILVRRDQRNDGLASFRENFQRFGNSNNPQIKAIVEQSCSAIMLMLIQTASRSEVLEAYAAWYERITFVDEKFLELFQTATIFLLIGGVAPEDILEILERIPGQADKLSPLVVALRQEAGEKVRAPREILETAADVRNEIDALRKELQKNNETHTKAELQLPQ